MGYDSIPFEEPELFTARSGLQAKERPANRQDSTLHLRLDSQDDLGNSFAEVGIELQALSCCTVIKPKQSHFGLMCSKWQVCQRMTHTHTHTQAVLAHQSPKYGTLLQQK